MKLDDSLAGLTTEAINPRTVRIDELGVEGMVRVLHDENASIQTAVENVLPKIAQAIDMLVDTIISNQRMVYIGAGTSGRLGILDASEMPPTFGLNPSLIGGIIAGGREAVFKAVEGAEDDRQGGANAVQANQADNSCALGMVVGISASGRAPFVLGALEYAALQGMRTVLISTNQPESVHANAPFTQLVICAEVGPEPITGSTRMKSGTAQKLILNMITTGAMIQLGKTYGNVMVDVQPSNEKLRSRAIRIVSQLGNTSAVQAEQLLVQNNWNVKTSIVMLVKQCDIATATAALENSSGRLRLVLEGGGQ